FFKGSIDEVRLWNVSRSQADIQGLMNQASTGSESGLVVSYHFNEGSGLTALDATSNHIDGFLGGVSPSVPAWTSDGAQFLDQTGLVTVQAAIDGFSATFSEDLLASAANSASSYSLIEVGPDGIYGTSDDSIYALTPSYSGVGSRTVTFTTTPNPL